MDAFETVAPVASQYSSLPVGEAFDWAPVAQALEPGEWYMVVFRSILKADADQAHLTRYDDWAHHEAMGAPGFLHYYKGPLATDRSCLSFCVWNSRAEARAAAARPAHRDAVTLINEMYEAYFLEFLRVRKRDLGASLEFEPYDAPPEATPSALPRRPQLGLNPSPS